MFETKYLIIIGVVLCLLAVYYFYDEISNIKRTFLPTYQKTMALEAKLLEYEKNYHTQHKSKHSINKSKCKTESPIMSITYASSDVRTNPDGTSSIRYANITDLEAKELLNILKKNKDNPNAIAPASVPASVHVPTPAPASQPILDPRHLDQRTPRFVPALGPEQLEDSEVKDMEPTVSDTIHVKASELGLDNNRSDYTNILNAINNITDDIHSDLHGINSGKMIKTQKDYLDMELDLNVVKSISDSVHKIDLPIEDTYSDIPISKLNQYKSKQKKRSNEPAKENRNQSIRL